MSGDLWSDLLLDRRVVSTQLFAGAHVLAQPALFFLKLVEPGCDEGAARVETILCMPGELWSDLFLGCRVVSTQPFAGAHVLAQPALFFLKLVEPGCDEGAARVETILCVPGGPVVACGNFGLRLAVKLV